MRIFLANVASIDAPSSSTRTKVLLLRSPGVVILLNEAISLSKPLCPLYIDFFDSISTILSTSGISANSAGT